MCAPAELTATPQLYSELRYLSVQPDAIVEAGGINNPIYFSNEGGKSGYVVLPDRQLGVGVCSCRHATAPRNRAGTWPYRQTG